MRKTVRLPLFCYLFKIGCPSNGCCYLFTTKKSVIQMTREIRSDSAFCDTLNLHNVQNKQFHIRRSKFCRRYCLVDVKMFVVSFTFATQQSTNKMPKQNNLLLGTLALWGVNYMPFCSLLCFHLAEKVKKGTG